MRTTSGAAGGPAGRRRVWIGHHPSERTLAERLGRALAGLAIDLRPPEPQAGQERDQAIQEEIERADAVVLLLSADLLHAAWLPRGLARLRERQRAGALALLPVLARPCALPPELSSLPALPVDGTPLALLKGARREESFLAVGRWLAWALGLPAPEDTQRRVVDEYRRRLQAELGKRALRGIAGLHQPGQMPHLSFHEVYVTPRLLLGELGAAQRREEQELRARLDDKEISQAKRAELEERIRQLHEHARQHAQPLAEVLAAHRQLVVLGKPGSGKTSLLAAVALEQQGDPWAFPVWLSLADLGGVVGAVDLLAQVRVNLCRAGGRPLADAFDEALHFGRAALLLDGADEVPEDRRVAVMEAVERLLRKRPELRCIVTSRPVAQGGLSSAVPHADIAPLSLREVREFIGRYLRATGARDPERAAEDLLVQLRQQRRLLDGPARTPLLLLILCLFHQQGTRLPRHAVEFYRRATETLLTTWNRARSARPRPQIPGVHDDQLGQALARVALASYRERLPLRIPRHTLTALLAAALAALGVTQAERRARSYLAAAVGHAGLLIEAEPERYEFLHLSFREYLAAVALVEAFQRDEAAVDLWPSGSAGWEEVLAFAVAYAGVVRERRDLASRLLRAIARERAGWDRLLAPRLRLAVACLEDGTFVAPAVAEELVVRLAQVAALPWRPAGQALGDLSRALAIAPGAAACAALALLLDHVSAEVRAAAVRLLARAAATQPEARAHCQRMLGDGSRSVRVQAALGLLHGEGPPQEALEPFIKALSRGWRDGRRGWDGEPPRALPEPLLPLLRERLAAGDPELRHGAAVLLALCGSGDEPVRDVLLEALGESTMTQDEVRRALEDLAQRQRAVAAALVPALFAGVESAPAGRTVSLTGRITPEEASCRRRQALEELLRDLGPRSPEVVGALAEQVVTSDREEVQRRASELLEAIATPRRYWPHEEDLARPGVELVRQKLLGLLPRPDLAATLRAIRLLAAAGTSREVLGPLLVPALSTAAPPAIRRQAAELALAQGLLDLALPAIVSCLRDGDRDTRWELHGRLCDLTKGEPQREQLAAALRAALVDPLPALRFSAVYWLLRMGRLAAAQLPELLAPCLAAEDLEVRDRAAELLDAQGLAEGAAGAALALALAPCLAEAVLSRPKEEGEGARRPLAHPKAVQLLAGVRRWHRPLRDPAVAGAALRAIRDHLVAGVRAGGQVAGYEFAASGDLLTDLLLQDAGGRELLLQDLQRERAAERDVARVLLHAALRPERRPAADQEGAVRGEAEDRLLQLLLPELERSRPPERRLELAVLLRRMELAEEQVGGALRGLLEEDLPLAQRMEAAYWLTWGAALPEEALRVYRAALAAEDLHVRLDAAERLLDLPQEEERVRAALVPLLAAPAAGLRFVGAALLSLGDEAQRRQAAEALVGCLGEREVRLGSRETWLLDAVLRRHGSRPRAVVTVVDAPPGPEEELPLHAMREDLALCAAGLLYFMGERLTELRQTLERWLAEGGGDRHRRHVALEILHRLGGSGAAIDAALATELRTEHAFEAFHDALRLRPESEALLPAIVPWLLDGPYGHYDACARKWIQGLLARRPEASAALLRELRVHLDDPEIRRRFQAARWVYELAPDDLDDRAAQVLAEAIASPHLLFTGELPGDLVRHPRVQRALLARCEDPDPYVCFNAGGALAGEDPPPGYAAVMRRWLTHGDFGLRVEGAAHLRRLGLVDGEVVAALRGCLVSPPDCSTVLVDWGVRKGAAEALRELGLASDEELAAALLPCVRGEAGCLDGNEHAARFLLQLPALAPAVADALCEALRASGPGALLYTGCLALLHGTGLRRDEALLLTLRVVAEPGAPMAEAMALLRRWDLGPEERGQPMPHELLHTLPGRAQLLAEAEDLPVDLTGTFAQLLGRQGHELASLERQAASEPPTDQVALLLSLITRQPTDTPLQRLARLYFFFRFNRILGLCAAEDLYTAERWYWLD